jgi:hypothetical protein
MNRIHHLAAALVLSFALVLLPSIAVQAPNAGAFATPAWQILLPSLLAFLTGWAVLALLSLLASWSPRLLVAYLVAAVAALLCSQVFGQAEGVVLDGARRELTVPWCRPRAMPRGLAGRARLSRSRPCPATSTSCT